MKINKTIKTIKTKLKFLLVFASLGGSARGSWCVLGARLADVGIKLGVSWAILDHFGFKLAPSWQDVGSKMPKMSEDSPTWEHNGSLKSTNNARGDGVAGCGGRVGEDS